MFLDCIKDLDNYESRKIGKIASEDGKTIGVSTAHTSDEGYETALLDSNGIHPVERYEKQQEAKKGHEKWIIFAKSANGKIIKSLGWSDIGTDKDVLLCV